MRSAGRPEPVSDLRVEAVFAAASLSCLSLMRAASTDNALARFLCCERLSWHSTTMPVGRGGVRATGARTPERVDAKLGRIQHDLADGIGLGKHSDGTSRGVDAALRLGFGH